LRQYLTDDSRHVLPHTASLAFDSGAFASGRDVLTGKASRNDINTASPWVSVKGLNVIPDRERRQASVVLAGNQDARCVCVPLHSAHGVPSKKVSAEYPATSACEKSQLIELIF
jgi:hypothetical protein